MSAGDSEGPAWNKFWMSMDQADTESALSGEGGSSHIPHTSDGRSAMVSPDLHRPGGVEQIRRRQDGALSGLLVLWSPADGRAC